MFVLVLIIRGEFGRGVLGSSILPAVLAGLRKSIGHLLLVGLLKIVRLLVVNATVEIYWLTEWSWLLDNRLVCRMDAILTRSFSLPYVNPLCSLLLVPVEEETSKVLEEIETSHLFVE